MRMVVGTVDVVESVDMSLSCRRSCRAHVDSHVVAANVSWVVVLDSRGVSGAATGGGRGTGIELPQVVVMAVLDAKLVVVVKEIAVVLEG